MLDRYLFSRLLQGHLALTLILTAVFWLVQALDLFDKSITAGASPLATMGMSLLVLPRVLTFTLGPALLIVVLSQMVRLLQEYEYFALTAAGLSPLRILRPVAVLALLISLVQGVLAFYVSPIAMKELKRRTENTGATLALAELQPGAFKDLKKGMTVYTSGRGDNGKWQDVMIYESGSDRPTAYLAKQAVMQNDGSEAFFVLENGTQQITDAAGNLQLVRFSQYVLPLQAEKTERKASLLNRNHMMIHQLLNPEAHGTTYPPRVRRMKARGLELIANTATPFVFMLVSFAAITAGGINRHGYGKRIMAAVGLALLFQIGVIAAAGEAVERDAPLLVFVWPAVFFAALFSFILLQVNPALARVLRRKEADDRPVEPLSDPPLCGLAAHCHRRFRSRVHARRLPRNVALCGPV